jgi:hypothetical protein
LVLPVVENNARRIERYDFLMKLEITKEIEKAKF